MKLETTSEQTPELPDGVVLPQGARIPEGASFFLGEDDGWCRVIRPDGERCRARRMVDFGICAGHGGRGLAADPQAAQQRSREVRAKWKARRHLLGIPASGRANPRQLARLRALTRAEELAEALVDGPLDDSGLNSVQRQVAAVRILDAVFPVAETTVEVEFPTDPAVVERMSWSDMQRLAARLHLDDTPDSEIGRIVIDEE